MSIDRVNFWWQNDPIISKVISFNSVSTIPYCWIIIPNYALLLVLALFPFKCRYFLTFSFLRKGRALLLFKVKGGGQPVFVSTLGPFSPHQKVSGTPENSRCFHKAGHCSGLVGQSTIPTESWHCRHISAGTVCSDDAAGTCCLSASTSQSLGSQHVEGFIVVEWRKGRTSLASGLEGGGTQLEF